MFFPQFFSSYHYIPYFLGYFQVSMEIVKKYLSAVWSLGSEIIVLMSLQNSAKNKTEYRTLYFHRILFEGVVLVSIFSPAEQLLNRTDIAVYPSRSLPSVVNEFLTITVSSFDWHSQWHFFAFANIFLWFCFFSFVCASSLSTRWDMKVKTLVELGITFPYLGDLHEFSGLTCHLMRLWQRSFLAPLLSSFALRYVQERL